MPQSISKKNSAIRGKKSRKRKNFRPSSFLDCQSLTHVVGFPPQNELVTTPAASELVKEIFLERFGKEIVRPFQPEKRRKREGGGKADNNATNKISENTGFCHVMIDGKLVKKRSTLSKNLPTSDCSPPEDTTRERKRRFWKESVVIGSNQCLKVLESMRAAQKSENNKTTAIASPVTSKPLLIVLTKDMYPPTLCASIPVLAKDLDVPLLLLPGKASIELGKALKTKRASVIVFLSSTNKPSESSRVNTIRSYDDDDENAYEDAMQNNRRAIDSFVSFIKEQMTLTIGNDDS